MRHKKFFLTISLFFIFSLFAIQAQVRTINNMTFVKVDNLWYQLSNGKYFRVDSTLLIVKFVPGTSESEKNRVIQRNYLTKTRLIDQKYYTLRVEEGAHSLDKVETLLSCSCVELAEPNTYGEFLTTPNDPKFGGQWYLHEELKEPGG